QQPLSLTHSHLDGENAPGAQEAGCVTNDPTKDGEAVRAAREREPRLEIADVGGQGSELFLGNVRRVGRDELELRSGGGERLEEVAEQPRDLRRGAEPNGVFLGDGERVRRRVDGEDLARWALFGDRYRDAA